MVVFRYGKLGGKLQEFRRKAEPTNVGRANMRTGVQQAEFEAQAEWDQRVKRKYRQSVADLAEQPFLPILAHKWADHEHKLKYPIHVQPKYDGFRCLARRVNGKIELTSRNGEPYNVPHIAAEVDRILGPEDDKDVLDGELYTHGVPLQRLQSIVTDYRLPDSLVIEYHVYDMPRFGGVNSEPWCNRWANLQTISKRFLRKVRLCHTEIAANKGEVEALQRSFIELGFEGAIARGLSHTYRWGQKRSDQLLKVKTFVDAEFTVVGFEEDVRGEVVFICRIPDGTGRTFNTVIRGTHEERVAMFKAGASYVGRELTVKMANYTPEGKPFHPVGVVFRSASDLPKSKKRSK